MQLRIGVILATISVLVDALSFLPGSWPSSALACPSISPGPATLHQLSELPLLPPNAQAEATIRQLLTLYAFAVDARNFDTFDRIFTTDVRANYSAPLNELTGLDNLRTAIDEGVSRFAATHHSLGTQYIATCGRDSAVSVTYYTATHFLNSGSPGEIRNSSSVLYATARYEDSWRKLKDGTWKIFNRNNVFTGPLIADL